MEKENLVCFGSYYCEDKEDKKFVKEFCSKCEHLEECKQETEVRENEERIWK